MEECDFAAEEELVPGMILSERYQIVSELGRGGMGTVFKAKQAGLNKTVAVKVLNSNMVIDQNMRTRFEREAQSGAKLSHPNLISVYDYGFTTTGSPFLVMEYAEGTDLEKMIAENGPIEISLLVNVISQIARALQLLHDNSIVHRDVKASNILVQSIAGESYARLLDLGIVKVFSDQGDAAPRLTATGAVYGSAAYMSPEQCQGRQIDGRSDIYAIGCVLYECISGDIPFKAQNHLQVMLKHLSEVPEPLPCKTEAEKMLARVVQKCMEKEPEKRYQTMNALVEELRMVDEVHRHGKPLKNVGQSTKGKNNGSSANGSNNQGSASVLPKLAGIASLVVLIGIFAWLLLHQNGTANIGPPLTASTTPAQPPTQTATTTPTQPSTQSQPPVTRPGAPTATTDESSARRAAKDRAEAEKSAQKAAADRAAAEKAAHLAAADRAAAEKAAKSAADHLSKSSGTERSPTSAKVGAGDTPLTNSMGTQSAPIPMDKGIAVKDKTKDSHKAHGKDSNKDKEKNPTRVGGQPMFEAEKRADRLASAIVKYGLMSPKLTPALQDAFFAPPAVNPSMLTALLAEELTQRGHNEYSVTMPAGENRVLIRRSDGNARSIEFGAKETPSSGGSGTSDSPDATTADGGPGQLRATSRSESDVAQLARTISEFGLMHKAVEQSIQDAFYVNPKGTPAELARDLQDQLHKLGHKEIGVTMPEGQNRVLIRDNKTGNARSVQF